MTINHHSVLVTVIRKLTKHLVNGETLFQFPIIDIFCRQSKALPHPCFTPASPLLHRCFTCTSKLNKTIVAVNLATLQCYYGNYISHKNNTCWLESW